MGNQRGKWFTKNQLHIYCFYEPKERLIRTLKIAWDLLENWAVQPIPHPWSCKAVYIEIHVRCFEAAYHYAVPSGPIEIN